ncbi:MAG: hypothetical protein JSV88_16750 [Candidatus Aminicenantes bacterium]|nr:MAG: hypothetical protein JSV88_16750 [Candidatus Aminicenantes bacterium]
MSKMLFLSIVLVLFLGVNSSFCRGNPQEESTGSSDEYIYPVRPGTKQWKQFKNAAEKRAACQIPTETLKKMSTRGVVDSCINHPLGGEILFYNSLEQGFLAMVSNFNVFKELLAREDSGTELLMIYQKMDPEEIREKKLKKGTKDWLLLKYFLIELLLSRPEIIENLSGSERLELISRAYRTYTLKEKYPKTYGFIGTIACLAIMKRVMQKEGVLPPDTETEKRDVYRDYAGIKDSHIKFILSRAWKFIRDRKK